MLREYYQGKGKPRIIALYTELTSLKKGENENTTDYMLRAETASTALKSAEEVISDGLLIAMILKGLPRSYKTFSTVVIQREKPMTSSEFKTALRNYEENEKSCKTEDRDNVMYTKPQKRFDGKCFKYDKKGHKARIAGQRARSGAVIVKVRPTIRRTAEARKTASKTANEPKKEENNGHSFTFTLKDSNDRRNMDNENLLVDTGATSHIINDSSKFINFDENFDSSTHFMELADGSKSNVVLGKGNAKVKLFDVKGNMHDVMLYNALYITFYITKIYFQFQPK